MAVLTRGEVDAIFRRNRALDKVKKPLIRPKEHTDVDINPLSKEEIARYFGHLDYESAMRQIPDWSINARWLLKGMIAFTDFWIGVNCVWFGYLLANEATRPAVLAVFQQSANFFQNEVLSVPEARAAFPIAVAYLLSQLPSILENPIDTVAKRGVLLERIHEAAAAVSILVLLFTSVWALGGNNKEYASPFSLEKRSAYTSPTEVQAASFTPLTTTLTATINQEGMKRFCLDELSPDGVGLKNIESVRLILANIPRDIKDEFIYQPLVLDQSKKARVCFEEKSSPGKNTKTRNDALWNVYIIQRFPKLDK